ncbi:MAG: ABC transporter ATP-binding protein [Pyrinomonadaceae bacterium]|nr:ABC transporter ATP-binding protein [Sphingobacteriaceae bacterium]
MINIHHLTKAYTGITVVDIANLEIRKGETVGLVGNNGAGKTTLFRLVLDLIKADSGEVHLKNENVAGNEKWKKHTASFLDEGFLIDYLTPEEYFYFIGSLHGFSKAHIDSEMEKYADFFNGEILDRKKYIRDLSKGNQCKVGIVACLLQNPEVLLLDEPFANIDPSTQIRLKNLIKEITTEKQITTIISSHDLNHVTEVSNRILLMEKGKIIRDIESGIDTLSELEQYFSVIHKN